MAWWEMAWWEEALDIVGLSRQRINAFVIVVGVVAVVVLGFLYRGAGMAGAPVSVLLCLLGLVIAVTGAVVSIEVLGVHGSDAALSGQLVVLREVAVTFAVTATSR